MYMHFCSVMSFNKIADLGIDFGLNYGLQSSSNGKNARVDRSLLLAAQKQTTLLEDPSDQLDFPRPNPNEVYDKTTSILQLILLILFNRKFADLQHPDCFCNQILLLLRSRHLQPWSEILHVSFFPCFLQKNDKGCMRHVCCCNQRSGVSVE